MAGYGERRPGSRQRGGRVNQRKAGGKHIRGRISNVRSVATNVGVFVGQIIGLRELLGRESLWNFLFAVFAIPALVQLVGLFFVPESPRYLLMERKDQAAAERAFRSFHGKEDVSAELEEVRLECQKNQQVLSVLQVLRDPSVRWQLITAIAVLTCLQLSGVNAIIFYTTIILTDAGMARDLTIYITLGIGAVRVLVSILSNVLIELAGRRILIVVGFGGMAVCYGILTVLLSVESSVWWMPYLSFAFILMATAFFTIGPGAIAYVLLSELFEQSHRPAAFSISTSFNWMSLFVVGLIFPFMQGALQSYVFLVFLVICAGIAIYLFLVLPETKNKTFVEISQSFAQRNKVSPTQEVKEEEKTEQHTTQPEGA